MDTAQAPPTDSKFVKIAGYDLEQVEVALGQIDDVINNLLAKNAREEHDKESVDSELKIQKVLHSNNSLIQEIVTLYERLQKLGANNEDSQLQNSLFEQIVAKIKQLNEDLHLIFNQYRRITPVTEQKR